MQTKRTTEESTDRGVSPVIGVILMVAITVILAAVIAAFVLDIGPGEPEPNAAIEVDSDNEEVELISLNDADAVVFVDEGDSNSIEGEVLNTAGQIEDFPDDGEDNLQAVRLDDPDDDDPSWSDVEANAIVDNLDD